jgi:hypothetical protein
MKDYGIKKELRSKSVFLVKRPITSILTERRERQDIPVPATREKKSSEMVTFFVLHFSRTYIYIEIKVEFKLNFRFDKSGFENESVCSQ